jgi:hypothetical protein
MMSRRRAGGDDLVVVETGEHTLGRHGQMVHRVAPEPVLVYPHPRLRRRGGIIGGCREGLRSELLREK